MAPSAVMTYGSHLNPSRLVMVHWPTTGFLPNGRWSITLSTKGGVYISSFGRSWMEGAEEGGVRDMPRAFMMAHFSPLSSVSTLSQTLSHYHFDEEDRAGEVWALLHVPDDGRLHPLPTALHHQAR